AVKMQTGNRRLVLVLGVAALGVACSRARAEKPPLRPVRVAAGRPGAAAPRLRHSARREPPRHGPPALRGGRPAHTPGQVRGADGRLRSLQQGDAVTRGTVLARIDPADYQEKVNQARASVAEAEASLIKGKADAARAEALYQAKALTRPDYDAAMASLAA